MQVNLKNGGVIYTSLSISLMSTVSGYFVLIGDSKCVNKITQEEYERLKRILYPTMETGRQ